LEKENYVSLIIKAIDNKNNEEIFNLINNNNIKDIAAEIYNEYLLLIDLNL